MSISLVTRRPNTHVVGVAIDEPEPKGRTMTTLTIILAVLFGAVALALALKIVGLLLHTFWDLITFK